MILSIDEKATPLIENLCLQHQVNVSIQFSHQVPHKIGRWIHLPAHYSNERLNWSFCHELAHILLDHNESNSPSDEEEMDANNFASELILPMSSFLEHSKKNLSQLKLLFPFCSYEVLLRRKLQYRIGVGTILDEGSISFRKGNPDLSFPIEPIQVEWDVMSQSFQKRMHFFQTTERLQLDSVFVEHNGYRRVLLWTEPLSAFNEWTD